MNIDPMYKVENSSVLDKRTKKSIGLKAGNVKEAIEKVEKASGITYPEYYIEPVLTVVLPTSNIAEGLGVLYARTIPVRAENKVTILVEVTAPLVLYSTKMGLKLAMAHELLHYVELVRNFSTMNLTSQITPSSVFEERFTDYSRAVDPKAIFKNRRLVSSLQRKTSAGFDDPKLNEKCRLKWIERGLPVIRIPMASNQVNLPVDLILRTDFDPKVREIVSKIH